MGTNCDLLAYLFLYSYESDEMKLAWSFRYIDDVISISNSYFDDCVGHIYPTELEIKDTTYISMCASCVDIHFTKKKR